MPIRFDQAHAALAFLERHDLEPTPDLYDLALVHLSAADPSLSQAIEAAAAGEAGLDATRAAQLYATLRGSRSDPADPHALAMRIGATERDVALLRDQVATLRALLQGGDGDHDKLTNALNQTGARRILDEMGQHDRRFVVLMFGIDRLVGINREFGHSVGDNILNAFAAKLRGIFPEQEAIRWGGNEFIVVIPGKTITAVRVAAEEVLQLLAERNFRLRESGESIGRVTASAAIVPDHVGNFEVILREARAKIETAMAAGGNRVEV
ncbi:GGDEF domain-containing protein [Sphingomonas sp. 2R-10]|uniref:GGDEF domain-containing protein n=1 Tax=Sphingomonas sp. 2R-10 TaxID=3045148 RepID=UPI000F779AB5|nr:GGDEF domain-containing protein [Sphingomonas sp. 2R-10]MDJ0278233.1 GGDEF domain-containing protein [Sphingomonas sp. 2R-10]